MLEFQIQPSEEARLAALLGELLEGEGADAAGATAAGDVPAEIAEMRDMARLLRAASQSVPLPEGRLAVRRALLATLPTSALERSPERAAWRRTGRWLGLAAAMGMIVAAFGLGAGLLDRIGSPSNPLYGLRQAVDKVRLAFVPVPPEGAQSPFGSQGRVTQVGDNPSSGGGVQAIPVNGYPLFVQFKGVTIPSMPGQEVTVQGTVGGLPVTLSLTATAGCPSGKSCGDFEAWVTPLRGTRASAEFGQMRGTFICAMGECTLTPASKTGAFSTTSAFVMKRNTSGEFEGLVENAFSSLGDWVATVQQAAQQLKDQNLLPPGVTVRDLVKDATRNKVSKPSPQGMPGPSTPSGITTIPYVGVPTGTGGPGVTMGTGMGSSLSLGGGGLSELPGLPGGTGTSTTTSTSTSTSVTVSGTTVTSGTTSGSTTTPSGPTSGTISGSTSASGSVSGGTNTRSGGISATATGGVSGGMSGAYAAALVAGKGGSGGTGSGGTTGSGTTSSSGISISGGGVSVSVSGGGVSVSGGGLGGGGLGGGGALGGLGLK